MSYLQDFIDQKRQVVEKDLLIGSGKVLIAGGYFHFQGCLLIYLTTHSVLVCIALMNDGMILKPCLD